MNPNTCSFLGENKIEEFDTLSWVALGLRKPSLVNLEGMYQTDLFRSASPDQQEEALRLYPVVHEFRASEFKNFLEEASELSFDETLFGTADDIKIEMIDSFSEHYFAKNIFTILTDCNFSPLYVTDYCNGLAVLFVQNPVSLHEKICMSILKILSRESLNRKQFLDLSFGQQELICRKLSQYFITEWTLIGNTISESAPSL